MISGYQSGRADNPRAENSVSHIQTFGYRREKYSQYVIKEFRVFAIS